MGVAINVCSIFLGSRDDLIELLEIDLVGHFGLLQHVNVMQHLIQLFVIHGLT